MQLTQQFKSKGWRSKLFLGFLAQSHWIQVKSQICDTQISTWETLVNAINKPSNHGIVFLCPFDISSVDCPKNEIGYQVRENDHIQLLCEPSNMGHSQCTVDCPGIHFEILPYGALVLDGITLRGSENNAIRIQSQGNLMTINSFFENNINRFGNGGAINAFKNSEMIIEYTRFQNNEGLSGGSIYLQGNAFMKGSIFLDNMASSGGGGAIYVGADGKTSLTENSFVGNDALLFGPAVFDAEGGVSIQGENSGCANIGSINCDGVSNLIDGMEHCDDFNMDCMAPTSSPTHFSSATLFPSSSPSHKPSQKPSNEPLISEFPTLQSSKKPSAVSSSFPSHEISAIPTTSPSRKSSTRFSMNPVSSSPSTLLPVELSSSSLIHHSKSPSSLPLNSLTSSPESMTYCTWGSCNGIIRSSFWCNHNKERCVDSCGGKWCVE